MFVLQDLRYEEKGPNLSVRLPVLPGQPGQIGSFFKMRSVLSIWVQAVFIRARIYPTDSARPAKGSSAFFSYSMAMMLV